MYVALCLFTSTFLGTYALGPIFPGIHYNSELRVLTNA